MDLEASALAAWQKIQGTINGAILLLPNVVVALIVFAIFFFAARSFKLLVNKLTRRHRKARNLGMVLGRLTQGTVLLIGLFVALSIVVPTFQAGDLVQLLGISGVAIGFAFRDILQNFLAGVLILLTEPFRIDDQIVFKSFEGTVEDIQIRATTIRTYDGRRIVIPNSELFTNSLTVNTAFENRRLEYDIGIGYGDDIDRAKELILEAIHSTEGVLSDPAADVLVVDLAESTVNIRARWWVQPPRRLETLQMRDGVLTAIKKTLTEHGIDMPFPTQQILFHDQTEETDGDRTRQREGWPSGKKEVPKPRRISDSIRKLAEMRSQNGKSDGDDTQPTVNTQEQA
ncbi:mechanosensitive ion channel family protein [Gloeocapsopsis crepidinum LEGE 06123]|uniref:Mechanosensitive ion channel family protein n=1 Tax=Gloeocapsopsis crepidinum LEGE 06123 TaxID=588587 RepID=A0ABR9UUZ0_9CHRO|nr:mechanosensitive ion channel family protein [Gloeocapsopsis crepidinum]MBE9192120.1 mechanosensitive ion channel family protein [Gloeocapsopsis crepidinum LEGE 06123]